MFIVSVDNKDKSLIDSENVNAERLTRHLTDSCYGKDSTKMVCDPTIAKSENLSNPGFVMSQDFNNYSFIKLYRNPRIIELCRLHKETFILLVIISMRARRPGELSLDGLEIGEALVGDYYNYGLTERSYRTTKTLLTKMKIATFRATNKGTIAKLLDTSILDPNFSEATNETTGKRRTNDEQATTNKNKRNISKRKIPKEKSSDPIEQKVSVREFVKLTLEQHAKLLESYSQEFVDSMLDCLNSYKASNGKEYKSDYHLLVKGGWVNSEITKRNSNPSKHQNGPKEMVSRRFSHGESYNGADCHIDDKGIGFTRGMTHYQINFLDKAFDEQLRNALRKLGIKEVLNA